MENKDLLKFPEKLKFNLSGIDLIRLHEHGQAIFLLLTTEEKILKVEPLFVVKELLRTKVLNFQLTDFMFLKQPNFHGPYLPESIGHKDYLNINIEDFFNKYSEILSKQRKLTPKIDTNKEKNLSKKIDSIISDEIDIFYLKKKLSKKAKSFEHEWSHALTEYHEFLLIDKTQGRVFCFILTYD